MLVNDIGYNLFYRQTFAGLLHSTDHSIGSSPRMWFSVLNYIAAKILQKNLQI